MSATPATGRLGRYELIEELGRGMTAVVYKACDPDLGRLVAVKVVEALERLSDVERRAFEQRFFEQARLAGRLSHPGIVIAHDVGKDAHSGRLFIVYEYVEGRTLAERLSAGPSFDWRQALRIVGRVAEALHHAHANGVVHRDLRPSNIVLLASGEPKVMDFGVARLETARMTVTSIRRAFGVPLYMSPEQAVGESVDARTDLFSLGAVAYRVLTGGDAFAAEDPRGILARVVHDAPAAPSRLVAELPSGVDELIAHALAKSRKDRYPDGKSFAEDIEDILAGQPPRHSRGRDWASGTGRFQEALQASLLSSSSGRATGAVQRQADQVLLRRRRLMRGLAGTLALGLVVGLELLRRAGQAPVPTAPRANASAVPLPTASPGAQSSPLADPDLPSVSSEKAPSSASARLVIELTHTLKSGLLLVSVDGEQIVRERFSATGTRSFLGLKLREGRVRRQLELKAGRRSVHVQVIWDDERRSDTVIGTFKTGGTRRLTARLSRLTKSLRLEWE